MKLITLSTKHLPQLLVMERAYFSVQWSEDTMMWALTNPNIHAVGAEVDGIFVGYAFLRHCLADGLSDQAELLNIAVDAENRGRGIGTQLLTYMMQLAWDGGAESIFLEVRQSNKTARRLYTEAGFTPIGIRRGYYSLPTEDAVVMRVRFGDLPLTSRG